MWILTVCLLPQLAYDVWDCGTSISFVFYVGFCAARLAWHCIEQFCRLNSCDVMWWAF